jgi:hypothetical protein
MMLPFPFLFPAGLIASLFIRYKIIHDYHYVKQKTTFFQKKNKKNHFFRQKKTGREAGSKT